MHKSQGSLVQRFVLLALSIAPLSNSFAAAHLYSTNEKCVAFLTGKYAIAFEREFQASDLEPLDLAVISHKIQTAALAGSPDVHLPELRGEVAWALSRLSRLKEQALAKITKPSIKSFGNEISADSQRKMVEALVTRIKAALEESLFDPAGVPYVSWLHASRMFAVLATAAEPHDINDRDIYFKWLASYIKDEVYEGRADSTIHAIKQLEPIHAPKQMGASGKQFHPLPIVRTITIAEMNEWMAHELMPIGVVDQRTAYDGMYPWSSSTSALDYYDHDDSHFRIINKISFYEHAPLIGNGTLSKINFFKRFRNKLQKPGLSDREKTLHEVIWFFAFHERYAKYSAQGLIAFCNEWRSPESEAEKAAFAARLRPHDVGDAFGPSRRDMPTLSEQDAAITWLLKLATEAL